MDERFLEEGVPGAFQWSPKIILGSTIHLDDIPDNQEQASEASLKDLGAMIKELEDTRISIENAEILLKDLKKKEQHLSEIIIPDMLMTNGVSRIDHNDKIIEVKEQVYVSLPKEDVIKRMAAFKYISSISGGDAIIHREITIEDATAIMKQTLDSAGIQYNEEKNIHPATLKSFFMGALGFKKNVPATIELDSVDPSLGLFIKKQTTIKNK